MADSLLPRRLWSLPTITFPSLLEDVFEEVEELVPATIWPSTTYLQGLSISEDDKNVYVEAAVPGVDPKEIEVTYENGVLTIRGEKKEEEKGKTFRRRATRSFFYRISPGDVDPNKEPEAVCKNGVMTVTFAKVPEAKPKKIAVKTA
ncbi:MAG: heat-shock protein Hsp20 [Patescibacteria group bacterium]|nr:MAG: heat-shock protein Hsp20 [Patescibacteria group bacterium]